VTSEERPPPASRPGNRPPWRAAFFVLAAVGVIVGVAWALLDSRLLVVRSVTVTGARTVPSAEVVAAAGVPLGTPLIRINTGQVARRVEGIRQIASATVTKDWPDGLAITIRERTPVVAVRTANGGYDLVDPSGVIVRWAAARPAGMPLYLTTVPGGALRGNPGLTTAAAVLGELPAWLRPLVVSAETAGPAGGNGSGQVTLDLRDGKTVLWGGTDRAAEKGRELAILIRGPARYYDVSAPGTVVTR
jgi:cell division protein FtsQ